MPRSAIVLKKSQPLLFTEIASPSLTCICSSWHFQSALPQSASLASCSSWSGYLRDIVSPVSLSSRVKSLESLFVSSIFINMYYTPESRCHSPRSPVFSNKSQEYLDTVLKWRTVKSLFSHYFDRVRVLLPPVVRDLVTLYTSIYLHSLIESPLEWIMWSIIM